MSEQKQKRERKPSIRWATIAEVADHGALVKLVPLTKGQYALVDAEDFDRLSVYPWHLHGAGYAARATWDHGKRGSALMHREILNAQPGIYVDHINRNRLDNRKANLRLCSMADNQRNAVRRKKNATSQYKGVYFSKQNQKWRASLDLGSGRKTSLGLFESELEAAKVYDAAARARYGEFPLLNFPEGQYDRAT